MAVIKSGATSDQLTVDATSKAARVTQYTSAGVEITPLDKLSQAVVGAATPADAVQAGIDDGTNLQAIASASAANLTGDQTIGKQMQLVVPAATWSTTSFPGTATQATANKAANAAGRHVCTAFSASIGVVTTSTVLQRWVIRDGATGAGTVLWQGVLGQNPIGAQGANQSGLALIGSTNTAMTIEFAAAGTTSSQEAVNMSGFDTV